MGAIAMRIRSKKGFPVLQRGLAVLRKYGADAHFWTAGTGWLNGVQAANFLDSSGTTAATVDNPIGLVLDQMYGQGALGAELAPQTSNFTGTSGFSTGNATLSVVGGNLVLTSTVASGAMSLSFGGSAVSGAAYRGSMTVLSNTAQNSAWYFGGVQAQPGNITLTGGTGSASAVQTGNSMQSAFALQWVVSALGQQVVISAVSIKQVAGILASQATTANKPTLRRGITNLQTYSIVSTGIGNSTYVGGSTGTGITPTITPNYGPDPFGGNTACRVQLSLNGGTTTSDRAYLSGTAAALDLAPRTSLTWVRTVSGTATLLTRYNGNTLYYTVDTNWQLIWVVGNSTTDPTHNVVEIRGGQSTINSNTADLLVATHGVFLGSVSPTQLLQCGGIPITAGSSASSVAGNFRLNYTTGGTQSLALQAAPFSVTDDHVVIQGVTVGDASATHASFAMANGNSRFPVLYVGAGGYPSVSWRDDTGVGATATAPQVSNGESFVLTARRAGSAGSARKNGVVYPVPITGLGTTTATTAYIGASTGGTINWAGDIYPTVIVKGTVSDADLLAIERMVGALTGPTGVIF